MWVTDGGVDVGNGWQIEGVIDWVSIKDAELCWFDRNSWLDQNIEAGASVISVTLRKYLFNLMRDSQLSECWTELMTLTHPV